MSTSVSPGLGSCEVEQAVDHAHQVLAARVDDPRVLDLLFGHGVAVVCGQLLGEQEHDAQRRAQLVRHDRRERGSVPVAERGHPASDLAEYG